METSASHAPLTSIVYVSSGLSQDMATVHEILRVSRINNSRLNITGMLAYKEGNFLQVLEGEEAILNGVIEKIEQDDRHKGMITLFRKPIKERLFANWSMAFRQVADLAPEDAAAYSPFMQGSMLDGEFRSKPEACYRLLLSFKKSMQ